VGCYIAPPSGLRTVVFYKAEMTVVTRPFVLDFAGAYLDWGPEFSDEVLAMLQVGGVLGHQDFRKGPMATPVSYHMGKFPPQDLNWSRLIPLLGPASAALARYDGLLSAIPNAAILLSPMTTREAVLSSKIVRQIVDLYQKRKDWIVAKTHSQHAIRGLDFLFASRVSRRRTLSRRPNTGAVGPSHPEDSGKEPAAEDAKASGTIYRTGRRQSGMRGNLGRRKKNQSGDARRTPNRAARLLECGEHRRFGFFFLNGRLAR
jgi:hypothetical protein